MSYIKNVVLKSPTREFYDYCLKYGYTKDNLEVLREDEVFIELFDTYLYRLKGKRYSPEAYLFSFESATKLKKKASNIVKLTWRPEGFSTFPVYHPSRLISSPFYADRVVENWFTTKYVMSFWEGRLHPMNMACRENLGPHLAARSLKDFINSYLKDHSEDQLWYFQGDMEGYFNNISHDYVMKLHEGMNPYGYFLLKSVMESWVETDDYAALECKDPNVAFGWPKGNLPSQWVGITTLNDLDWKMTERSGCLFYVRIMDDFITFYRTKEECREAKRYTEKYLLKEKIGVRLHPTKTKYAPIRHTFNFCGWQYVLKDGAVLQRVRTDRKKLKKKEWKAKKKKFEEGKISPGEYRASMTSTFGHYGHGDTKRLIKYLKHQYKYPGKEEKPKKTQVTGNRKKNTGGKRDE